MSREEKERHVIDLYYNQGKTFRDIAKELRMSPNMITAIFRSDIITGTLGPKSILSLYLGPLCNTI
jgi:transposase